MHQGTSQKNEEVNVASPENATSDTLGPFHSSISFMADAYRHHPLPKRLSQFSPTSPANGACSSREGESISEVPMRFEVATEFHATKQPPVYSDIAVCSLTMHWYYKS